MKPKLTRKQALMVLDMSFKRCHELMEEEIKSDQDRIESLDFPDQVYLSAYWGLKWKRFIEAVVDESVSLPAKTMNEFVEQMTTIDEYYGTTLANSNKTVDTVKKRLEATKRMIGDKFVHEFQKEINENLITSPIEQVFLMEWKYADLEKHYNVQLTPQAEIATPRGTYHVDFLISSKEGFKLSSEIVIELDGHEFHERTKQQVNRDNNRARALTLQGFTLLRFSGSEILGKSRNCMKDVEAAVEKQVQPS